MSENFVAPGQHRYLRACMVCSIVMTYAVSLPI
jgi:transcription elongation factor SPT4